MHELINDLAIQIGMSSHNPFMQYYTHREKMRQIGREEDLEKINRIALKIAREVANNTETLMAGGVCNTNIYVEGDKEVEGRIKSMFEEQVITGIIIMANIKLCDHYITGALG